MMHDTRHPLAGKTVTVNADLHGDGPGDHQFTIEDWNDRLFGKSWMFMEGHPASLIYAMRSAMTNLPTDNEVVYGKVGSSGHLIHVSELPGGAA